MYDIVVCPALAPLINKFPVDVQSPSERFVCSLYFRGGWTMLRERDYDDNMGGCSFGDSSMSGSNSLKWD